MTEIFALTGKEKGMAITSLVSQKTKQKYLFLLDCSLLVSDENERELLSTVLICLDLGMGV